MERKCILDKDTTMKLGLWLAEIQHIKHERGKHDCCTLFVEWHDKRFGTNELDKIYGKYNDFKSGVRFSRDVWPMSRWKKWFKEKGYKQVTTPTTGDIVMVQNKFFPSSYIICMNQAWSILDDSKRMTKHVIEEPEAEYSIWRY